MALRLARKFQTIAPSMARCMSSYSGIPKNLPDRFWKADRFAGGAEDVLVTWTPEIEEEIRSVVKPLAAANTNVDAIVVG